MLRKSEPLSLSRYSSLAVLFSIEFSGFLAPRMWIAALMLGGRVAVKSSVPLLLSVFGSMMNVGSVVIFFDLALVVFSFCLWLFVGAGVGMNSMLLLFVSFFCSFGIGVMVMHELLCV